MDSPASAAGREDVDALAKLDVRSWIASRRFPFGIDQEPVSEQVVTEAAVGRDPGVHELDGRDSGDTRRVGVDGIRWSEKGWLEVAVGDLHLDGGLRGVQGLDVELLVAGHQQLESRCLHADDAEYGQHQQQYQADDEGRSPVPFHVVLPAHCQWLRSVTVVLSSR